MTHDDCDAPEPLRDSGDSVLHTHQNSSVSKSPHRRLTIRPTYACHTRRPMHSASRVRVRAPPSLKRFMSRPEKGHTLERIHAIHAVGTTTRPPWNNGAPHTHFLTPQVHGVKMGRNLRFELESMQRFVVLFCEVLDALLVRSVDIPHDNLRFPRCSYGHIWALH